jgi:hypothetical protein
MFNEGVDVPQIDTVLFLRPTDSLTIFLQQMGRGLRLHEGKDCLTILDFVGNSNPEYDFDIQKGDFSADLIQHSTENCKLIWSVNRQSIRVLNLHIHSKLTPPLVRPTDSVWKQVISSANTGISVSLGSGIGDEIHGKHVGILNKIRFARKIGFVRQAGRILRYRLPRF